MPGGRDASSVAGEEARAVHAEAMSERILEATFACVDRWGIAKTTVEDAAREAGVSRATLYRYLSLIHI